jgi:hypothetical protein
MADDFKTLVLKVAFLVAVSKKGRFPVIGHNPAFSLAK